MAFARLSLEHSVASAIGLTIGTDGRFCIGHVGGNEVQAQRLRYQTCCTHIKSAE
jgi:hypothetical protein